jgi:hypothetical protein
MSSQQRLSWQWKCRRIWMGNYKWRLDVYLINHFLLNLCKEFNLLWIWNSPFNKGVSIMLYKIWPQGSADLLASILFDTYKGR